MRERAGAALPGLSEVARRVWRRLPALTVGLSCPGGEHRDFAAEDPASRQGGRRRPRPALQVTCTQGTNAPKRCFGATRRPPGSRH